MVPRSRLFLSAALGVWLSGCAVYTWDRIPLARALDPEVERFARALAEVQPDATARSRREDRLLFARALNLANRHALAEVSAEKLTTAAIAGLRVPLEHDPDIAARPVDGAIAAMLDSFDPEAGYLFVQPPGEWASVGLVLNRRGDDVVVVEVVPESPAEKAGVRPFDRIVSVDGRRLEGLKPEEIAALLVGPRGSPTTITVRPGSTGELRVLNLVRVVLREHTVRASSLASGYCYASIREFIPSTKWDLETELNRLSRAAPVKGLVLDLRYNTGGGLWPSIAVAKLFIAEGTLLTLQGRTGEPHPLEAEPWRTWTGFPIVVLTNKGTAAGAELVTAALVQNRRARSLGTRTFGHDTVRTWYALGPDRVMHITTGRISGPDGKPLGAGLDPEVVMIEADNELTTDASTDPVVLQAVTMLDAGP